jgi:hypothetical protein
VIRQLIRDAACARLLCLCCVSAGGEDFLYVFKGAPLRGSPAAGSTAPGMRPVPADPAAPGPAAQAQQTSKKPGRKDHPSER